MEKRYVKIEGIQCAHCVDTIQNALLKKEEVKDVKIKRDIACITLEGDFPAEEMVKTITGLGYFTKEEYISSSPKELRGQISLDEFLIILCSLLLIAYCIQEFFGFNIFNMIPTIDSSITYGMLVVTGLFTSIHCISMCGAINLTAAMDAKQNFGKPILYNLGRLLSYTVIGGIVGLLGSVLSLDERILGIVILAASILMFLMALSMLGILDFRGWKCLHIKSRSRNAFVIGLLNGFMPCGPLQAMQLYALSTGSMIKGALSMFLFGIGTVPLMLFMGIFLNMIRGKGRIWVNRIASVLILLLSVVMFNRGLLSLDIDLFPAAEEQGSYVASVLQDDYQVIEFDLTYSSYEDILLQKDVPVKMIIHVDAQYLTGCNSEVVCKEFGFSQKLQEGDNVITFTPKEEGTFTYTCWMNMIKNNIKVIDNKDYFLRS